MPVLITKDNFEQEVTQSKLPIIIDVFATWCGPCQYMAPIFDQLEKELGASYKFTKLNVDESRELAIQYGVTSIPTFVFIKDGQIKGKETGSISKEDLIKKINTYFK
ncbi:thioredoxin [Candidatus Dependentiae bacterium]|nr:thioredoxin [Candidatus Dependentiae bacterium]